MQGNDLQRAQDAIAARLNDGASQKQVASELVAQGWEKTSAKEEVKQVADALRAMGGSGMSVLLSLAEDEDMHQVALAERLPLAMMHFVIGGVAVTAGTALTVGTYALATTSENRGIFFVFFGLILYGLYRIWRGALVLLKGD